MRLFALLLASAGLTGAAHAAPMPPSPACPYSGVVEAVVERVEKLPDHLASGWGVEKDVTYIDVTLLLDAGSESAAEPAGECVAVSAPKRAVFQLGNTPAKPDVGMHISGEVQWAGDEFYSGHFITITEAK